MLQPTDRVIAKTLVRMYGSLGKRLDPYEFANTSMLALRMHTEGNPELQDAVMSLIKEVNEELQAEQDGTSSAVLGGKPEESQASDRHENWD